MSLVLDNLLSLLSLEKLEVGLFRGQSQDIGFGHLFGGHIMAQALSAAKQTVAEDRHIHSFHSYFLRAGDEKQPIIYDVEIMRDGGSFSARRVKAIQKGRAIFYMTCSFQAQEEGFDHQSLMPDVSGPQGLMNQQELAMTLRDRIPAPVLAKFMADTPFEMRLVEPVDFVNSEKTDPTRHVWVKANGVLPSENVNHESLLAYVSDFNFLVTAAQPHGVSFLTPGMRMATIDHAMWFHRPFSLHEWLLFSIESPNASGSRGFVKGQFYDLNGKLVASATQEGLLRMTTKGNTRG
ncbi:acyl-CoA thioesterase domain-containing protein [Shewanella intestini]|uniref:Acyl-CoA thioesterase II n=1 Tax=Shewanella intestini TaxID=2017544 RepID=A0ABS5I080_9GAMM|nr:MULTISPECIES: acyl-CoA thioesterase domain-containing protein [Shewanella]MBR9727433.1 acyl-CoA thioesterase II [Shewanella intestini]MRG35517.1 acyl-CoA thioesterase II [Shewanella sp. XMDDZSB0408]